MFVRWQKRKNQYSDPARMRYKPSPTRMRYIHNLADTHLAAILIESVRIDGKPRQRHIAYLAGINEKAIVEFVGARVRFWREVDAVLHRLSNRLTAAERERIVAAVAAKVPRPTPAEAEQSERELAESFVRLKELASRRGWGS
jgi:hypothetical protein